MSLPDPRLPEGFRALAVDREKMALDEACRLARCQKAEPGDFLYSRRHGMASCAILLDSDRSAVEAAQALPLAQLAVAESLHALSAAQRPTIIWPFSVCLGAREVARVAIGGLSGQEEAEDYPDWLVIGLHIRLSGKFTERLPALKRRELTALASEGIATDRTAVLQHLAAAMQRRLAEWQNRGFEPIRSAWTAYTDGESSRPAMRLDKDGNAMIDTGEGFEKVALIDMIARQLPLHLTA
ncbi:biotin/lipoate--protein ligase family protein [Notoacmeibacter marinus]|nr:biotin/lipoate--protein ligase family protein [Notoacmeibacter marinus]